MKSFAVFQVPGYIVALLGSTGVQAIANHPGLNFAAVTSTLTAFGTRFSNLPTVSSPSTTTVVITAVAVDDFQNQMSTTSVIELTRSRTSTISITLSPTLSDTKVNIPTSSVGILSTIALDSNKNTIPSPTSSAFTKQTRPSPHRGIFVSLLSSQSVAVVLPVNSLSGIPPITSSNTVTKSSQLPNHPVQKVALTTPNSDVDDELTIPPPSTVFTTLYPILTVIKIFTTAISPLPLSNLPSSDRNNPTGAAAVLNLLATGPSLKENTTLTRILSTAKNVTYFSPTTFTSLSPPVQALLSQSHSLSTLSSRLTTSSNNKSIYTKFLTVSSTTILSSILSSNLPSSDVSTNTKFLTVPSTTITQQSIITTSALNKIPAPQSSRSSSPISIFRGIFRNLSLPSTRADTDDSSLASLTSPSPPNNNNNNSSSSVLLVKRRTMIPAYSNSVPNNDNNDNNDIRPSPIPFLAWSTKRGVSILDVFPTDESLFRTKEKAETTMYPADNNSKQPVRTEPSSTQSGSPTTSNADSR